MNNFLSFYKRDSSKPTKTSRMHHQTNGRLLGMGNRKGLNFVAKSHSAQMENPIIERFKNNKNAREMISSLEAKQILKDYKINHNPRSYTKAINRTGIYIHFNQETSKWFLTKNGGKV